MRNAHQLVAELAKRSQINPRWADCHCSTNHGIEHPTGDRYNDPGLSLHLKELPRRSLLHATHQNLPTEIRVVPVMDFQLLPDMGRMLGDGPQSQNALFAGHDQGAENWACIASLIETCKLNGDVLTSLANLWPVARLDELMPWAWAAKQPAHRLAA